MADLALRREQALRRGLLPRLAGSFDLPVVALRFANVYGPISAHKKGVITNFIRLALAGEPLVVFGDGAATRDFLYVEDLATGSAPPSTLL